MINKFIVVCILSFLAIHGLAQTGSIRGIVLNNKTYERLPYASIYLNHTTIGTSADDRGEFILKNIPFGQHELVITFVGHHNYQAKIIIKDTASLVLTFRLNSKQLKEIQINSKKDKAWEKQYEKFKKLFLGSSVYAAGCEILNPWILDFKSDNKGFFNAVTSGTLEIENFSLRV